MDIKAELEALRDDIADIPKARHEDVYGDTHECLDQLDAIIARLPPDAVVVRDVGAVEWKVPPWKGDEYCYAVGWDACRRAMLQAAEENNP